MNTSLVRRWVPAFWQLGFILLATTWLWAPLLNHQISYRTSLISQYEAVGQPYAWLFRLGDLLSAVLLLAIPILVWTRKKLGVNGWLLAVIAAGMLLDPVFSTSCRMVGHTCQEYTSLNYIFHAVETVITSAAIFTLALYDYTARKKLLSAVFVIFQILYGLLFVTQLASNDRFNTASQYVYQISLVLWLAWYVRESFWQSGRTVAAASRASLTKNFFAVWALLNGFLAILISLAHIHLLGRIHGVYFAGDSAWLAQHGVVVGVVMIYLSRHLARGERRARQIFLLITGIEVLKYSVITPNTWLLALYGLTFCALFIAGSSFDRGQINLNWDIRLKDAAFVFCALLAAIVIAFGVLDLDEGRAEITNRSLDHFFDYTLRQNVISRSQPRSALLAHTSSVFLLAGAGAILWILFKPQRIAGRTLGADSEINHLLQAYSNSSEDYFKLWPPDKNYFQSDSVDGFIAYKVVGPIAFALADPIAANQTARQKLLRDFVAHCRNHGLRVCFLPIVEQNLKLYRKAGLAQMQIGATALIEVDKFLQSTAHDKWWRWQINRAAKIGYQYQQSQPPHSRGLVNQMKKVSDSWLGHGGRQEYGFGLGHFDKNYLNQTSVDYLTNGAGELVAFTNRPPLLKPGPIITIDLLRYTPDAKGAMPYLLLKSIEQVKGGSSYRYFDLGFVPFAASRGPILSIAKTFSRGRFSSRGLEQFKNKFDPVWQPMYMAYDGDLGDLALIAANIERAMELTETE